MILRSTATLCSQLYSSLFSNIGRGIFISVVMPTETLTNHIGSCGSNTYSFVQAATRVTWLAGGIGFNLFDMNSIFSCTFFQRMQQQGWGNYLLVEFVDFNLYAL